MPMETFRTSQQAFSDISEVDHSSKLLFENVDWFDTANERHYYDSTGKLIRRGDMLAFNRDNCDHFALYMGRGAVVHVTKDKNHQGWVLVQPLELVRNKSQVTIRNHDKTAKNKYKREPRTFREIINALPSVGEKIEYDLFSSNCEHYCTLWRYGVSFSIQAQDGKICFAIFGGVLACSSSGLSSSASAAAGP